MARPLPILFIHGFNGDPGDWTDGGFRQYLLAHGDLDPDLVRLFHSGNAPDGTYNNRGDLRQIAARLGGAGLTEAEVPNSSLDRLSADSVAKGGPAQVTVIAHSLGGIIGRYYLSHSSPDEFGTLYRGNVGRLITIGSPHRGVDLMRLTDLAPRNSLPWRFIRLLERLGLSPARPGETVDTWDQELQRQQREARAAWSAGAGSTEAGVFLTDTPIYQQLRPDSPLLAALNQPGTMPVHVKCHTFYGDIRVGLRVTWGTGGPALLDQMESFGDLAVPAYSAREIPGAQATPHPFVTEKRIELAVRFVSPEPEASALAAFLPDTAHAKLLSNPAVHAGVLSVLND
jgi:pimeloyl-ACP methyl ester carboxylesterase